MLRTHSRDLAPLDTVNGVFAVSQQRLQAFRSQAPLLTVKRAEVHQIFTTPALEPEDHFLLGLLMARIDLDWPAQVKTCQIRIAELEEKIATQRQKIQHLSEQELRVKWAQCLLVMRQESLERAQSRRDLIESRIADRARRG
jgi:hypothetical protein